VADLPKNRETAFDLSPDAEARRAVAEALGLDAVKKLRLTGTLAPLGRTDWRLEARLGATVVQPCVVTLQPVTTRIDADVERTYLADAAGLDAAEAGDEAEMPEDVTLEPLPPVIDLARVMEEALALEVPDYPRAPGAELEGAQVTAPGAAPMTDEDARPFAALKGLRDKLSDGDGD
jgi:uncharacterized metal-binding protein YceD (DUF177 family)